MEPLCANYILINTFLKKIIILISTRQERLASGFLVRKGSRHPRAIHICLETSVSRSLNHGNQHKEVLAPRRASVPAWETACSGKAQLAVDPWFRNQQGKTTAKLGSRSTSQTLGYFRGGTSQASGRLENFHHCLLQSSLISGELTIPPATQRSLYAVGKGPTPESSERTHYSPQSLGHRGPLERPELRQRGTRDSWRNQKQPKQEAAFAPGGP